MNSDTRPLDESRHADFRIRNLQWGQFIMGCSRSCDIFQPIIDTHVRHQKIREEESWKKKKFLNYKLVYIYIYREGNKVRSVSNFHAWEYCLYIYIFFFKSKCDLSHVPITAILNPSRNLPISWLFPSPPSTRTLKQLRAHDLVDEEEAGRGDRKYRTCARANRGLYEYRGWSEKDP